MGPDAQIRPRKDGKGVREQARALLEGRERWRPMWVDYGAPREVEVGERDGEGAVDVPVRREVV